MRQLLAIVLALTLAGCSLVRPGGPNLVKFDATVCVDGVTTIPCFAIPNLTLPDDAVAFAAFAKGLAEFYMLPMAGTVGDCTAEATVTVNGPGLDVEATLVCPNPAGGDPLVQHVGARLVPTGSTTSTTLPAPAPTPVSI